MCSKRKFIEMKNIQIICSLVLLFVVQGGIAMDAPTDEHGFVSINDASDVEPFRGQVVVYTCEEDALSSRNAYPVGREGELHAGIVSECMHAYADGFEKQAGYDINTLIKKDAVDVSCSLINRWITGENIKMRKASVEEKAQILAALDKNVAKIEYAAVSLELEQAYRKKLTE